MSYLLCISNEENWNVIKERNVWGTPERHKNIARVKPGVNCSSTLSRREMKLLFTLAIFAIFLISTPCLAQPVIEWSRTYGKAPLVGILDVKRTSDGLIMAGYKGNAYDDDAWIIKTDFDGREEWNVSFGGKEIDLVSSIEKLSDGYIAAGFTGGAFADGWLIKIDNKGSLEWSRYFGTREHEEFRWVEVVEDGFIIAGSKLQGDEDAWLVKTDFKGDVVWSRTYGGKGDDAALCVKKVKDGYIIAGFTESYGAGKRDGWLLKVDFEGNELWNVTFGGKLDDEIRKVQPSRDGFILAGYTESFGNGKKDAWVIKVDEDSREVWNVTLGGDRDDEALAILVGDGYLIAGFTESFGVDRDGWLIKVDSEGREVWNSTFGGKSRESFSSIVKLSDGYVLAGSKQLGDNQAAWLVKVREMIEMEETEQSQQAHQISPMQFFAIFLAGVATALYLLYRTLR